MLQKLTDENIMTLRKLLKHNITLSTSNFVLFEQIGLKESTTYMSSPISFISSASRLYVDNTDFEILNFLKIFSIIFGNLNFFIEKIKNIEDSKETIEYESYKDLISFLALQNHISEKVDDALFFEKYHDQQNSGFKYLTQVSWPKTKFLGLHFSIQLKWARGNIYDSSVSYFFEANAINENYEQSYNNKPMITIKISDIFKAIEKIVINCKEKSYLHKANIIYQNNISTLR